MSATMPPTHPHAAVPPRPGEVQSNTFGRLTHAGRMNRRNEGVSLHECIHGAPPPVDPARAYASAEPPTIRKLLGSPTYMAGSLDYCWSGDARHPRRTTQNGRGVALEARPPPRPRWLR